MEIWFQQKTRPRMSYLLMNWENHLEKNPIQ